MSNFDFDDTQYALRDMARDLFAKESPAARLRELWDGKPFDRRVWKTMAEAGIVGITVPEAFGGAGGSEIDLALVFEEAGRAALPEPLLETTAFAAPVIAEAGSDELRERWLPAIASGDAIVAVEGPVDGHVAWADEADLLIVMRNMQLHAVPRERYRTTSLAPLDPARPIATVDADTGPETLLVDYGSPAVPPGARIVFGTAAMLNGIAMHLIETTVGYVKDRQQFGRPVGSFQAVKHKLASMHVAVESARPAAWYAAYACATGSPEAATASSIAKVAAADAEALCNGEALQCHGGIGFTWEHDLHFWLKRGIVLRSAYGTPAVHRQSLVPAAMQGRSS
jgi:alkylation response protein AidB-like acyl-CoA dehydrogenase